MSDTRAKLIAAATASLRDDGIQSLSARGIAGRADVNQALVFYHFGTVTALVDAACRDSLDRAVDSYRDQLGNVSSLADLMSLGRALNTRERDSGNVAIMAQLMAAAQHDDALAGTARYCLGRWADELHVVLDRCLEQSPARQLIDVGGLARAVAAGFIGLELYDGVDPSGAQHALQALEQLTGLVDVLDGLGSVGRRAVQTQLRRRRRAVEH